MVNNTNKNTRYKVSEIDGSSNTIVLEIIEGYDAVTIGSNVPIAFTLLYTTIYQYLA
jgi:hypothetical protein